MLFETAPRLAVGQPPPAGHYDADIIILALNRFQPTLEAVLSALRQKDIQAYVAVLDQGSAPPVRARFIAAFAQLPNFGYFVSETNRGVGGGRNFLAGVGHGKLIIGLDNDAVFATDRVVAMAAERFATDSRLGALGFAILTADGTALDHASWGYPAMLKPQYAAAFPATTFVGAGHAIRRASWGDVGGYDETLFFTWEEYDFSLRAIARGWGVAYDGQLAVRHRLASESRVTWSAARTRFFIRNRILIARKWRQSWWVLAPRILAYLVNGARNRRLLATIAGIARAVRDAGDLPQRPMPPKMRAYIRHHEQRHRGTAWQRLRHEVFGKAQTDH